MTARPLARPWPARIGWAGTARLAAFAAVLAVSGGSGVPAAAQTTVDLQLMLAVDASGSVNQYRFELQKRGYVAAFRNPRVLQAILGGRTNSIAVAMTQWTGPFLQVQVLPWTLIKDDASVETVATIIEQAPRQLFSGGTSISGAIDHAMSLFPQSPFKAERQVIDVSGDGSNNAGRSVTRARDDAVNAGATINGLPILAFEPNLDEYYKAYVIGGPGAFVIAAENFETFADAILKKMIIEIAGNGPTRRAAQRRGLDAGVVMK
jgi:hypothetical protein